MPLYKTITASPTTKVVIWKITESLDELSNGICLTPFCQRRLDALKSDRQKRQFLSIRHLLSTVGYTDQDIHYESNGKPHLVGEDYISMTHSHHFSGLIISSIPAGIDIEKNRDKILRVAERFTPLEEYRTLANTDALIRKLTIVWSAKEAIYKILSIHGLSFRYDIYIADFDFDTSHQTQAEVLFDGKKWHFTVEFMEFDGFTCVYTLSSKQP